jgi:hypothetical protein
MISLDIIVGYYLPSLFGWAFLGFVLISECLLLSRYLEKKWYDKTVFLSIIASNVLTTIIGFILLDEKNSGGHLLNWIPVDVYHGDIRIARTIFLFISSFIATVIIEALLNWAVLRKAKSKKQLLYGTLIVNAFTYIIGAMVIFVYTVFNNPSDY